MEQVARIPRREVHRTDGVAWLRRTALPPDHAIVTSLPDVSELNGVDLAAWRAWFVDTVAVACRQIADDAVAIFYQTDVKRDGRWIDKGFLVQLGADAAGSSLLWHKVVCRVAPGTVAFGRPAYAHMICVSRARRIATGRSTPDVLPALGTMTWARAMGTAACEAAARFLVSDTDAHVVVDPFCGVGTMLAVANAHGLDAVGCELSRRRAARAAHLTLPIEHRAREPAHV